MNAMTPDVTFLVPTYNYGRFLEPCVRSITGQTFTNFELIILDDASTDNTPDIVERLRAEDNRIQYIRHPENVGHLTNYNIGIQQAKGQLIWLISADDMLADNNILHSFVEQFKQNPQLGYCFSRVQCMDNDGIPYDKFIPNPKTIPIDDHSGTLKGKQLFQNLLKGNFVPAPGAIARKACYEQYGLFHLALTHSGDWYNWLAFALDWDVYYYAEPAVYYRKHPHNMHQTYKDPRHGLDNSLLCLNILQQFLTENHYDPILINWVNKAEKRFKAKHNYPLSLVDRVSVQMENSILKVKQKLNLV